MGSARSASPRMQARKRGVSRRNQPRSAPAVRAADATSPALPGDVRDLHGVAHPGVTVAGLVGVGAGPRDGGIQAVGQRGQIEIAPRAEHAGQRVHVGGAVALAQQRSQARGVDQHALDGARTDRGAQPSRPRTMLEVTRSSIWRARAESASPSASTRARSISSFRPARLISTLTHAPR